MSSSTLDHDDVSSADTARQRRRAVGVPVPREGEGGLFSQSWFPICLSSDIARGGIKGAGFLDGRVVAFRGEDGVARVMSAYCPHLGADLAVGKVVGDVVRCSYHQWEFDGQGVCVKTGIGDPPPPGACLFAFPTREKYGIVWAFNGQTPTWELPEQTYPDHELITEAFEFPEIFDVDPWVLCAQTPDIQHVNLLHKFEFLGTDPTQTVVWTDNSMTTSVHARVRGYEVDFKPAIFGTSVYFQLGTLDGRWYGFIAGMGIPKPGSTQLFFALTALRGTGPEEEVRSFLEVARKFEIDIASEDLELVRTAHFRAGSLTRSDVTLARFLKYVRNYPRAHPAADFIV